MKRKSPLLLVLLFGLIAFTSCEKIKGEGPVVTETRSTSEFERVNFGLAGTMIVEKGENFKVEISAQRNILEVIRASVSSRELKLDIERGKRIKRHEDITVRITMPEASGFTVSGSGNIRIPDSFTGTRMRLHIAGSGNIEAEELDFNRIEGEIDGSGNIRVRYGSANDGRFTINGSGSVEMPGVEIREGDVTINGSGSVRLWTREKLKARINGSGTVYYKGQPTVDSHVAGSGRVVRVD